MAYPLTISLPQGTVRTGYGTACPGTERSVATYRTLAERHGFTVVHEEVAGPALYMELEAP